MGIYIFSVIITDQLTNKVFYHLDMDLDQHQVMVSEVDMVLVVDMDMAGLQAFQPRMSL